MGEQAYRDQSIESLERAFVFGKMKVYAVVVVLASIIGPSVQGLSCDIYRGVQGLKCSISGWVCGQHKKNWERRYLTLTYDDGRTASSWESRSPCRGGTGGAGEDSGGCKDEKRTRTCEYWKNNYGCSHPYVKPRCCATCKETQPVPTRPNVVQPSGGNGGGSGSGSGTGNANACLADANKYRRDHRGTPLFQYDNKIANLAQAWANKLLQKMLGEIRSGRNPRLQHDPNNRQYRTGENIYYSTSSRKGNLDMYCKHTDSSWYDEIKDYSYQSHGSKNGKAIGHFTQMVWKGTEKVGYAVATAQDPRYLRNTIAIVVAKYSPPGNYRGEYAQNVLPK